MDIRHPRPRWTPRGRVVLALAVATLAACATSSSRAPVLLSSWTPPAGQTCDYDEPDGGIPPVDAFVDSAGLHEAVAGLWARAGARAGRALFSIQLEPDSNGVQPPPVMIEDELPPEVAVEVMAGLTEHLRPPEPGAGRVRLEIAFAGAPEFRAGGTQTCVPVLRNRDHVNRRLWDFARTIGTSGAAVVWLFIDTHGRVMETKINTSSGDPRIDGLALGVAREMLFHPGLNDRVPVPLWVSVPVRVGRR